MLASLVRTLLFSVFVLALTTNLLVRANVDADFDDDAIDPEHDEHNDEAGHYDQEGHHDEDYDHDAVAGSHADADAYKELEPEEAKKRLGELITNKMDTNKDGTICKAELKDWIMKSFENLDREHAKQKMDEEDTNKDNKTDWLEFVHHSYGYTAAELEALKNETNADTKHFLESLADEREKFDLADVNKDGALDLEEYKAFAYPQHYAHMAEYEIKHSLRDFDKNKDGFINESEFISSDKLDQTHLEAEKEHFKQYDKNQDGKLDKEEMVAWLLPGFEKSADSEVQHLFAETDTNKDDKLDKDEILNQHELWVGSHATDYGKHLEDLAKTEL